MPVDPMIARGFDTGLPLRSYVEGRQNREVMQNRNALTEDARLRTQAYMQEQNALAQRWRAQDAQAAAEQQAAEELNAKVDAALDRGDYETAGRLAPELTNQVLAVKKALEAKPAPSTVALPGYGVLAMQGEDVIGTRPYPQPQQYGPATWNEVTLEENGVPVVYSVNTRDPTQRVRLGQGVAKPNAVQSPKNVKDAGLAQGRINAARVAMKELSSSLAALQESKLYGTGPVAGRLGQFSKPNQRFDAAVKRLFGHMQAITRIPGIGQQSDWEGRMQLLTLPSSEYDESVNAQAISELQTFLQDVESAYETAFGQAMPHQGAGASGGWTVEEVP